MSYSSAQTSAELFTPPRSGVTPAFTDLLSMPFFPVTDAQNELIRQMFTTFFHVTYGRFDPLPYGPGNNIVMRFNREYNALFMGGFTVSTTTRVDLGALVTFNDTTARWDANGEGRSVTFERLNQTVTNNGQTGAVHRLLITRNGTTEYCYYLVPVTFSA